MGLFHLLTTDSYKEKSGEKKTFFTHTDNALPDKKGSGTTVHNRSGMSLSGKIVIFPTTADTLNKGNQREGSSDQ